MMPPSRTRAGWQPTKVLEHDRLSRVLIQAG
jgi:hypothetical protein